jgi:hypothetical protein
MKRALAIVCLLAGSAAAETTFVKPPAGWTRADDQARSLAAKTNEVSHFGGAKSLATAEAFVAPTGYAAGLYITAVVGKVADHRDAAARVEVDSFLAAPKRAQLSSPQVSVEKTASAVDPAKKQIDATVTWTDQQTGISTASRMIVVADAENIIAVTAECSHGEMKGAHVDACLAALATLDPGVALDKRQPISLAPEGSEPPPGPDATGPKPSLRPPSTMSDGSRAPMPPINIQSTETKRTTDKRPVYVGLGIVALAALFWWNRRRRERFEKEPDDT